MTTTTETQFRVVYAETGVRLHWLTYPSRSKAELSIRETVAASKRNALDPSHRQVDPFKRADFAIETRTVTSTPWEPVR